MPSALAIAAGAAALGPAGCVGCAIGCAGAGTAWDWNAGCAGAAGAGAAGAWGCCAAGAGAGAAGAAAGAACCGAGAAGAGAELQASAAIVSKTNTLMDAFNIIISSFPVMSFRTGYENLEIDAPLQNADSPIH